MALNLKAIVPEKQHQPVKSLGGEAKLMSVSCRRESFEPSEDRLKYLEKRWKEEQKRRLKETLISLLNVL